MRTRDATGGRWDAPMRAARAPWPRAASGGLAVWLAYASVCSHDGAAANPHIPPSVMCRARSPRKPPRAVAGVRAVADDRQAEMRGARGAERPALESRAIHLPSRAARSPRGAGTAADGGVPRGATRRRSDGRTWKASKIFLSAITSPVRLSTAFQTMPYACASRRALGARRSLRRARGARRQRARRAPGEVRARSGGAGAQKQCARTPLPSFCCTSYLRSTCLSISSLIGPRAQRPSQEPPPPAGSFRAVLVGRRARGNFGPFNVVKLKRSPRSNPRRSAADAREGRSRAREPRRRRAGARRA